MYQITDNRILYYYIETDYSGNRSSAVPCLQERRCSRGSTQMRRLKKNVHLLDTCSAPIAGEEEGSGDKRLCRDCSTTDMEAIDEIAASSHQGNWRGLVEPAPEQEPPQPEEPTHEEQPPKKYAKYVKGTFHNNDFETHKKLKHIPILRNGNVLDLQPAHIDNKYYTAANTCAFDSLVHLFLVIEMDSNFIKSLDLQNDPLHIGVFIMKTWP